MLQSMESQTEQVQFKHEIIMMDNSYLCMHFTVYNAYEKITDFEARLILIWKSTSEFTSFLTLSTLSYLSESTFPHLYKSGKNIFHICYAVKMEGWCL